jgi:hypothetical protein
MKKKKDTRKRTQTQTQPVPIKNPNPNKRQHSAISTPTFLCDVWYAVGDLAIIQPLLAPLIKR